METDSEPKVKANPFLAAIAANRDKVEWFNNMQGRYRCSDDGKPFDKKRFEVITDVVAKLNQLNDLLVLCMREQTGLIYMLGLARRKLVLAQACGADADMAQVIKDIETHLARHSDFKKDYSNL